MTKEQFIDEIAKYVNKYAPQYGIKCYSAIISQAILESNYGTSELAVKANNFFGLKYNPKQPNRCPSACGYYVKTGSEQNKNGTYTSSTMLWQSFNNMNDGVKGYFDFINTANYRRLKGISDPQEYLKMIKSCNYCTSINYVQNCMNIVNKYNLTRYDEWSGKMNISIHAGHNPDGKVACGAVGLIRESTEARKVKDKVIEMLKSQGHTVYDCTVDNGTSQNDVLKKIVSKCNEHTTDLDVSIHFNSGGVLSRDGKTTGTEVFVYNNNSKAKTYAQNIVNAIAAIGYKNRGVKYSSSLYFLKHTKNPALLIECCFVTDPEDVDLYNPNIMAQAIVKGITGAISEIKPSDDTQSDNKQSSTTTPQNSDFKVKIKVNSLNIRAGAGIKYKIVGSIKDKGIYTIIDTCGNWGLLKSKKGWINISNSYVTKV